MFEMFFDRMQALKEVMIRQDLFKSVEAKKFDEPLERKTMDLIKRANCTAAEHLLMTGVILYAEDTLVSKASAKATISDTTQTLGPNGLKPIDLDDFLWGLCSKVARGLKFP